MKIQAISDLHLEFRDYEIKNNGADVLVLAGDILVAEPMRKTPYDAELTEGDSISEESHSRRMAVRYRSFLKKCSKEFDHVIYVAGNHEFYNGKWNQGIDVLRTECERYTNVHFLDDETININGVNFIGGTLWTDYNGGCPITKVECQLSMNDYRKITDDSNGSYSRLNPNRVEQKNRQTAEYIRFKIGRAHV